MRGPTPRSTCTLTALSVLSVLSVIWTGTSRIKLNISGQFSQKNSPPHAPEHTNCTANGFPWAPPTH